MIPQLGRIICHVDNILDWYECVDVVLQCATGTLGLICLMLDGPTIGGGSMKTGKMLADFVKLWAMVVVLALALAVGMGIDIYPFVKMVFSWLIGG